MSDWITDRLPTIEDSVAICVYVYNDDLKDVRIWTYGAVKPGQPWQPIPRPAPYVKPKRWKIQWNNQGGFWMITDGISRLGMRLMDWDRKEAAQRICDIHNEVVP